MGNKYRVVLNAKATKRHNNKYPNKLRDIFGKVKVKEIIGRGLPNFFEFTIKDIVLFVLIFLATMAIGLFLFNNIIDWRYKQELLMYPCELCENLRMQAINSNYKINFSNLSNLGHLSLEQLKVFLGLLK